MATVRVAQEMQKIIKLPLMQLSDFQMEGIFTLKKSIINGYLILKPIITPREIPL